MDDPYGSLTIKGVPSITTFFVLPKTESSVNLPLSDKFGETVSAPGLADKLHNFEDHMNSQIAEYRFKNPTGDTLVAERNEAAQRLDNTARYQAALGFGPDFATHINRKIDKTYDGKLPVENESSKPRSRGDTFTHVTAQGTVVGIDSARDGTGLFNSTIQVTRKDGLQLNFKLTEDMRITDLEDGGLAIYYAATGMSRVFDAEGRESTVQGEKNALGTSGNDLIINVSGKHIDAGDGDDTIFNFADNATILGGAGNDKIYLSSEKPTNVTVDGGTGDDAIVGEDIQNATIVMKEGTDSLTAYYLTGSNITSNGNNAIKIRTLSDSQLVSRNGLVDMNIANILDSSLSIDRVKALSSSLIRGSNLSFGDDAVTLNAYSISESHINTGRGNDSITAYWMTNSFVNTNAGDDTIEVGRSMDSSTVDIGSGKNTVNASEKINSHIYGRRNG